VIIHSQRVLQRTLRGPFFIKYSILEITMSTGSVTKVDLLARIYKLKTSLYNGQHEDKGKEWHDGAHSALTSVLDILDEYSR
jgi:hypothetical protein